MASTSSSSRTIANDDNGARGGDLTTDQVFLLESQLNSFRHQLNVVTVELDLTRKWLHRVLGAEFINMDSEHYKMAHGRNFELDAIRQSLELDLAKETEATDTADSSLDARLHELSSKGERAPQLQVDDSDSSETLSEFHVDVENVDNAQDAPENRDLESESESEYSGTVSPSAKSGTKRRARPKKRSRLSTSSGSGSKDSASKKISSTPPAQSQTRQFGQDSPRNVIDKRRRLKSDTSGSKARSFTCRYCSKKCSSDFERRNHERIHTGEKPFKCRFCKKWFARTSNKIEHERVHTGEKPHKCRHCPATFAASSSKTVHERIHTGERPYACEYCGKSFKRSTERDSHARVHRKTKPEVP